MCSVCACVLRGVVLGRAAGVNSGDVGLAVTRRLCMQQSGVPQDRQLGRHMVMAAWWCVHTLIDTCQGGHAPCMVLLLRAVFERGICGADRVIEHMHTGGVRSLTERT